MTYDESLMLAAVDDDDGYCGVDDDAVVPLMDRSLYA